MVVTKTRLEIVPLGLVLKEPGEEFGAKIAAWLAGAPAAPDPAPKAPPVATPANLCAQIAKAHGVTLQVLGEWLVRRGRNGKESVTAEDVAAWKESCEAEAALRKPAPDDRHLRAVHGPPTTATPIDSDDDAPF